MKKQLEKRLLELKNEFAAGEKMMADLQNKQAELQSTLLRLSGAIQVLEEELGQDEKIEKERNNVPMA